MIKGAAIFAVGSASGLMVGFFWGLIQGYDLGKNYPPKETAFKVSNVTTDAAEA